ncbi:MAG TPA: hypothetical protein VHV83_14615, partial [Armatimonadota bacterium]|nr:hypothetical protein [Armatimonadota bacterium]
VGTRLISRVKVAANTDDAARLQAKADPTTMVLSPVASPLFVSGMSDTALKPLQKIFSQYNLQAMPGPGSMSGPATKLEPGSAVAVSLMEGDANLSAVGTVTYVKGDTVLAFGHPFMGVGKVNMPMSTAYVQGIVNSSQSSFKLASPMTRVGTLTSDREFAVGGIVGQKAKTLPVSLHLSDQTRKLNKRYAAEMVQDPAFTPALLYMYVLSKGASQMADFSSAEGTFTANTILSTTEFGDIAQQMIVSPQAAGAMSMPMSEFYMLTDSLMLNPYDRVNITKATIDLAYQPERNIATIEKVTPDRPVAHPGETVNLAVNIRPYGKPVETRTVSIKVPRYASEPMMMVVVAGGANALQLKPQLSPLPSSDEGVRGIIRWLTDNPTAKSIMTAQVLPSASYAYRGRLINELPSPMIDVLRYGDSGGSLTQASIVGNGQSGEEMNPTGTAGGRVRPAMYLSSQDVPYILSGGQLVMIAIDAPEQRAGMKAEGFSGTARVPALSSSITPDSPSSSASSSDNNSDENSSEESAKSWYKAATWLTPVQRARQMQLFSAFDFSINGQQPVLRIPHFSLLDDNDQGSTLSLDMRLFGLSRKKKPSTSDNAAKETKPAEVTASEASNDAATQDANKEKSTKDEKSALLTQNLPSWGLVNRNDFLRGSHFGTTVSSNGSLVLMPKVRSIYRTSEMLPWKMVSTSRGVFIAGWNSVKIVRISGGEKDEVIFPQPGAKLQNVETTTALAADSDGNLLVATWPDQHVRLLKTDGTLLREWTVPTNMVFDLAVTTDGKRYASGDQGTLYLLQDDNKTPVKQAITVPDKDVYTLTAGNHGDVYLATAPRGKVYRLSANGELSAVFEADDLVASLATDVAGNVYVGTSPSCSIYRITPNGAVAKIFTGAGNGNRHVLSLKMVGDDLYATTGPAGGIYRISQPAGADPDYITILARDDSRTGQNEDAMAGPESIMVNALAVTPQGDILAAASTPGQILKLEPRTEGMFVSSVLTAPSVAHWGQLDVQFSTKQDTLASPDGALTIETRSGQTAWPDETWSKWASLQDNRLITSPSANHAQIRVVMKEGQTGNAALRYIRAFYLPNNQQPMIKLQQPSAGAAISGKKEIKWEAKDPDNDQLVYTAFASSDGGQHWKQLSVKNTDKKDEAPKDSAASRPAPKDEKKATSTPATTPAPTSTEKKTPPVDPKLELETTKTSFTWDTKAEANGTYMLKVVASDKYAKPTDPKSAEMITGGFIIDNTPPTTILDKKIAGWDTLKSFTITDNLTPLVGGKFRFDDGAWIALTAQDGVFDSKSERVQLISPDGPITLATGEHKMDLIAEDAAGNQMNRTITVVIP